MDPSEKIERLIDEALTAGREDLDRIDRLIAGKPAPATAFGKVARCFRCHASPLSAQEIQNGWLCQACSVGAAEQMLACLEILANAGGTVFRDADADLKIDDNGDLAAKPCASAPTCCDQPMRRTCMSAIATLPAYLCNKCERYEQGGLRTESQYWRDGAGGRRAWQDVSEAARVQAESSVAMPVGFTAGGSYVVGDVVSTPTGKFECAATGAAPAQPCAACGSASTGSAVEDPAHWNTAQWRPWCGSAECRDRIRSAKSAASASRPVSTTGMCAGPDAATGETSIHFYDDGAATCRCGERSALAGNRTCSNCGKPSVTAVQTEAGWRRWCETNGCAENTGTPADVLAWLDERIRLRSYGGTWTRYSCRKCEATLSIGIRTDGELVVAVKLHEGACSAEADGLPVVFAPSCGHRALTEGCSTCAGLRERMARIGCERETRIMMADVGPADVDDLRRQFGLPEPPESLPDAWSPEAMQRYNKRDRERVQQALARHATFDATPPVRPDGFSQAAVDAAKAVLLAPVVSKKGGR